MKSIFSRIVYGCLGFALGGVGVLSLLSKKDLVVCRSDYQKLASEYSKLQRGSSGFMIADILLLAMLKSPPSGSRVLVSGGLNTIGGTARNEGDGRGVGHWTFVMAPPPTRETWPSIAESIKRTLADDQGVKWLARGFGFKLEDVEWRDGDRNPQGGEVTVKFIFSLQQEDAIPPKLGPGGILKDLFLDPHLQK
jgi:hypothetical protein